MGPHCESLPDMGVSRILWLMSSLDSRPVLRLFTATQAVGAFLLALVALQAGDPPVSAGQWPLWGLLAGGVLAALTTAYHNAWLWAVAGTLCAVPMFVRAADLIYNHESFQGRVELRWSLWLVLALGTVISWAVVGALAGLDGDRDD